MYEFSLKQRLLRYLKNNPGWIAKGELERIVAEKTTYTAENVGRRMRELENEGSVEVEYRKKHHAFYRFKQVEIPMYTRSLTMQ